ncbi:MAG TPA: hypothetical protein PKL97_05490 [Candidatus Omnitrophota bacterium]|nr:hypothetical protein [Candidatus Omnitrophota bacterium]
MFERKLMMAGIQRQRDLLRELIGQLEVSPRFDADSGLFYDRITDQVVSNLKGLRKLKKDYRKHQIRECAN